MPRFVHAVGLNAVSAVANLAEKPLVKGMATVADQLRQAREAQKLSVYDVADLTKIKTDHIRALEEGRYDVFAAPVYIRGFVRNYAATLQLDSFRLIEELEAELGQTERFREPSFFPERKRTLLDRLSLLIARLNWRWAASAAVAVVVVVFAVWTYRSWDRNRPTDPLQKLGPGLYRSPHLDAGEILPLPAIVSTQHPPAL